MPKVILGVDGGGTKSHLAVFDEAGKCVGTTIYGILNHESMSGSYAQLEERLYELLPRTLKKAGATPDDVAFAVLGLAGVDTVAQEKIVSDMVRKTGIEHFIVCNDAILGVPAGCPDSIGICAINGTGFKLAAIDRNGLIMDTCGLGSYTDDRGGGYWYAERACGELYNSLYKLARPTKMRDMLFDLFRISNRREYLETITDMLYSGTKDMYSVELCRVVFDAAALGDEVALDILDESAMQYAGAIARLAMDMYFPCDEVLYVTFAGSVFVKEKVKILPELIQKRVAEYLGEREVEYISLDAPPVTGAVVLAAQKVGLKLAPATVKRQLKIAGL